MTNLDLLISAHFCSILHVLFITFIEAPFAMQFVHLVACYTSLQNHALTHWTLKWLDRVVITIGVLTDFRYALIQGHTVVLTLAVLCYLYSKCTKQIKYHMFAHVLCTLLHIWMYITWNLYGEFSRIRL